MGLDRAPGADAPDDLSEQPDAACAPFLLAILGDIATAAPKTFRVDDQPDDVSAVIEALIRRGGAARPSSVVKIEACLRID